MCVLVRIVVYNILWVKGYFEYDWVYWEFWGVFFIWGLEILKDGVWGREELGVCNVDRLGGWK